jgi:hypothetical protein
MRNAAAFVGALATLCLAHYAGVAWAGPTAQTAPLPLSACTNCLPERPAVAGSPTGFLTVWEESNATEPKEINGRLFNSLGAPLSADFLVHRDATAPDRYDPAVARDTKGNFIVVWSSVAGGNSEIMGQKLSADGAPVGAAFKVNQDPPGPVLADLNPVVARTSDGGFIVSWISLALESPSVPASPPQVLARWFNASGLPVGAQVKLSTGLVNGDRPDVCVDSSGKPIVVWTSVDAFRPFEPSKNGVSLRTLSAKGALTGKAETVVSAPAAGSVRAAVSCGTGGTFVVVWHSDRAPGGEGTDILGQRFNKQGKKVGAVFRVNTVITGFQRNPAVSHDAQGNFVVVWQTNHISQAAISGRRFNAGGVAKSPDFEVISGLQDAMAPSNPDVAHVGTAGNFVVVWQAGVEGIFGRPFTP